MSRSSIEWTDETWNPVTGCEKVSPGCKHCYAERFAERFRGVDGHPYQQGFDPQLRPDRVEQPRAWKSPRMVFVNSMSDLFGDFVPDSYLAKVFRVMRDTPQHTYQILTKRAERLNRVAGGRWPAASGGGWTASHAVRDQGEQGPVQAEAPGVEGRGAVHDERRGCGVPRRHRCARGRSRTDADNRCATGAAQMGGERDRVQARVVWPRHALAGGLPMTWRRTSSMRLRPSPRRRAGDRPPC
ncbi:MAG: DUF5131 family protein [Kofleriaceae bacterium]|nr:DUF5131 family protein [Kofleriaceae bacterium]